MLMGLTGLFACQKEPQAAMEATAGKWGAAEKADSVVEIDLTMPETMAGYDTLVVEVRYDHSLKTARRYEAIPLLPLLRKTALAHHLDTLNTEVYFECKDGYIPSNSYTELEQKGGGFLAFRDLSAATGAAWPDSLREAYAPFYLVWEAIPYGDHLLAWPYGLVRIRMVQSEQAFAELYPDDRPDLVSGFQLYRENCLKCHALNGKGGVMGPEFNQPRNITTYWTRENIIAFARHPQAFRNNSKMPALSGPSDADFQLIVDYLEYMATRKPAHGNP
jgi:mono/diheme cytochrome c family protein